MEKRENDKHLIDKTYTNNLRKLVFEYKKKNKITLWELAEISDLPFPTINTLMYGTCTDCRLSTAVSIAKAIGIKLDEIL